MAHLHNEAAEAHLDVQYPVHNHGWVTLVDYMGNDTRIVEAARQSTTGDSKGEKKDRALLMYMFEHGHTSPFEMVETTWHLKMPIFVARQWVRHRTCGMNEYSGRYSQMKNEFYVPTTERALASAEDKVNTQGSSDGISVELANDFIDYLRGSGEISWSEYQDNLITGFSKEMSRIDLPLRTYTSMMWKMDLHNLFHFLYLRLHSHAQYEIRAYAEVMYPIVKDIAPIACEAFEEWSLYSRKLSRSQNELLKEVREYLNAKADDCEWDADDLLTRLEKAKI